MRGLLYFIPGARSKASIKPSELGIETIPDDAFAVAEIYDGGPDGGGGAIIAHGAVGKVGYYPDTQVWKKCAGGKFYLGWYRGSQPGPEDLEHNTGVDGHFIKLNDGNQWLAPVVRIGGHDINLPSFVGLNEDGQPVKTIRPEYSELDARAEEILEQVVETGAITNDLDYLIETAALALSVNYRVSKYELTALGLIDTDNLTDICWATIDGPSLKRMMKNFAEKKREVSTP